MKHSLKLAALLSLLWAAPAAAVPTVTEFPLPTASALPHDIVLGPDGKLWFTEKDANKIGRVTPGNPPVIDEFDLPAGFTDPFNITVGPDNQIWATCRNAAGAVCRINPADPTDKAGHGGFNVTNPAGIATGPDNAIWLGDSAQGKVVRIDAATEVSWPSQTSRSTGAASTSATSRLVPRETPTSGSRPSAVRSRRLHLLRRMGLRRCSTCPVTAPGISPPARTGTSGTPCRRATTPRSAV